MPNSCESNNALPSERRSSSHILYNCIIISLSLLNASLPAPLTKQSTPVPVMERFLFKYHQRVGYASRGRVEISFLKWGRRTKKFEKPCTRSAELLYYKKNRFRPIQAFSISM